MKAMKLIFGVCALTVSLPHTAQGALSRPKEIAPLAKSHDILLRATREALGLSLENRIEALRAQGPQGYRNLVGIMGNKKFSMEERWRAVTAIGRIGGGQSRPELERALTSSEWFMRNAGLVALSASDRAAGLQWAKKLLSDKALIVRSAAVDVIADSRDVKQADILWIKLNARENFKGGQSLFIRRRIVEALARLEAPGREAKFMTVLADKDTSLHPIAIGALERLTKVKLGQTAEPMKFKREHWQRWWREKAQAKAN